MASAAQTAAASAAAAALEKAAALTDRLPPVATDVLSRSGVPSQLVALGVPAEYGTVAVVAVAALLLVASLCCCCCCLSRGDGREPLLPKSLPRSDRVCRAANNCGLGDAAVSSGCAGAGAMIGGSKFNPANGCCAAAMPVAMPTTGLFADPPAMATGGCLGNVGGVFGCIGGSVESAIRHSQDVPRTLHEEAKSVTVVVADQEGGRGGGWGDLDSFDESITIKRTEYPTSRRGAALNDYYAAEEKAGRPRTGTRGGPEGGPPQNRRGGPDRSSAPGAAPRGRPSGRR